MRFLHLNYTDSLAGSLGAGKEQEQEGLPEMSICPGQRGSGGWGDIALVTELLRSNLSWSEVACPGQLANVRK